MKKKRLIHVNYHQKRRDRQNKPKTKKKLGIGRTTT